MSSDGVDSSSLQFLAVNYHYVAEPEPTPYPAIYPTAPSALRDQLQVLGKIFEFASGQQIIAALDGVALPRRTCIVTFDDGLRSQVENALPVLDELGIPALFFASGRPLAEKTALVVHQTHWVRSQVPPGEILKRIRTCAASQHHDLPSPEAAAESAQRTYLYDEPEAAMTKWLLNFALPRDLTNSVISGLFCEVVEDEAAWCKETYMDRDHIRDLADRGFLGNHGYDHLPIGGLSERAAYDQLARTQSVLADIGGRSVPFVSYPYGGSEAVGRNNAKMAESIGFRVGFTMERSLNISLADPLLLARIDTNDAPLGKSPLLALNGEALETTHPLQPRRMRYIEEHA